MNFIRRKLIALTRVGVPDEKQQLRVEGRNIYILPTRYGMLFAVLCLVMLIGSLNYNNNPAYLFTFLLISVGANTMYLTWRNLRGLQLRVLPGEPCFAQQHSRWQLLLDDPQLHEHPGIQLHWPDSEQELVDVPAQQQATLTLDINSHKRGWLDPGRLTLETRFPLGLFRAWCYLNPQKTSLVYAQPIDTAIEQTPNPGNYGAGKHHLQRGNEDYAGSRHYRPGDTPRQIDWKAYAAEKGLLTKLFTGSSGEPVLFDWQQLPQDDPEWKIAVLTNAVLQADQLARPYGLLLPNQKIKADFGTQHRHHCLKALALLDTRADQYA